MNSLHRIYGENFNHVRGAAILLTVVLLLIMVTLVTLYTGKIQSFEHRILLNSQNQKWAYAAAQAGLNQAFAMLKVNKNLPNTALLGTLEDNSAFTILASSEDILSSRKLITIKADGSSADGLAKARVIQQALVYPILFNRPPAPLVLQGGFSNLGEFEVVVNPDGLSLGQPLSVWSDTPVMLSGTNSHTCIPSEFYLNRCDTHRYSDHTFKEMDIADNSASFPTDLLSYLFNVPATDWLELKQQADFTFSDCDALDMGSWGVIWISGDCEVSASTQIGSVTEPIILIVFDGRIEFDHDVAMYGLLLSFKPVGSMKGLGISMQGKSAVFGVVAANYPLGVTSVLTRAVYHSDVIDNLQGSEKLQRVARVPGSWHDF